MLHMVAEAMLGADRVAKITGNGPGTANSAAHMSQRAALRPKSSQSTRKFYHHWHILHHSHWHVVRDGLLSTHKSPNFPWPSLSSV